MAGNAAQRRNIKIQQAQLRETHSARPCTIVGCPNTVGKLSRMKCRKHLALEQKTGSAYSGDLPATLTRPARRKAKHWLKMNMADPWVQGVLNKIQLKIDNGPEPVAWKFWKGRDHDWRVNRFWGHIKKKGRTAQDVLLDWLTVELSVRKHSIQSSRYRLHQIARKVGRHASETFPYPPKLLFITLDNGEPGVIKTRDKRKQKVIGRFAVNFGTEVDNLCNHLLDHSDLLNPDLKKKRGRKGPAVAGERKE